MAGRFGQVIERVRQSIGGVEVGRPSSRWGLFGIRSYQPGSRIDWSLYAGNYADNAIVSALIHFIARTAGEAKFRVARTNADGEEEEIKGHPLIRFLEDPSPYFAWGDIQAAVIRGLVRGGNAYCFAIPQASQDAFPAEIQVLRDDRVSPISTDPSGIQLVTEFEYRSPTGKRLQLPANRVLHFRSGMDPDDPARGLSPLAACVREIAMDNLASMYSAGLLRNGGGPQVIISPEPETETTTGTTPDQMKDVGDLMRSHSQEGSGGSMALTVPVKVTPLQINPEQMALDSLRSVPVARICAAFGVDPMVLGMPSGNKTYANLKEAQDAAWHQCVLPMLTIIAAELQRVLLHKWMGEHDARIVVDTSAVTALIDDTDAKATRMTGLYSAGIVKRSDARRELGYEVDDSEDDIYADDAALGVKQPDKKLAKAAAVAARSRRGKAESPDAEDEDDE